MVVPTQAQVKRDTSVWIVLKADQGTGRQVSGLVQDVLTSGNHPRGIKVRLHDGRIGRVQRMASDSPEMANLSNTASAVQSTTFIDSQDTKHIMNGTSEHVQRTSHSLQKPRYRDVRLDEDQAEPETQFDLAAFVKVAKPKKKGAKMQGVGASTTADADAHSGGLDISLPTALEVNCPLCETFTGDEIAVSHHVERAHLG